MNKINGKAIFFILVSILIMLEIFLFSAQDGTSSSSTSMYASKIIVKILFFGDDSLTAEFRNQVIIGINGFVRKLAHFTVYAGLGFFNFNAVHFIFKSLSTQFSAALVSCVAYAAIDEIHQLYIPGRSGKVLDVFLDSCGSLFGIIVALIIISFIYYLKNYPKHLESLGNNNDNKVI